jgi:hypothetical protein
MVAIAETLTLTVGNAVAKWIFGAWLGEGLDKELSGSFVDTLTNRIPDFMQRRSIDRQAGLIAERTAQKLGRLIEVEFSHVDDGEQEAAVIAASETISRGLPFVDIFQLDVEPARLKDELLVRDRGRVELVSLTYDASRLYELLVYERAR